VTGSVQKSNCIFVVDFELILSQHLISIVNDMIHALSFLTLKFLKVDNAEDIQGVKRDRVSIDQVSVSDKQRKHNGYVSYHLHLG
jgi:ppGpp synthetase/RelA/SpoT-type nucleotidyltranferase